MKELRVMACRPVDEEKMLAVAPDLPIPSIYPGSAQDKCQMCETEIWVGPKVQEAMEEDPGVLTCFFCVAALIDLEKHNPELAIKSLGNTYERKP